jgi:endonuclease/exonuclease/phosphatase (EEP) superfamily protein YafD
VDGHPLANPERSTILRFGAPLIGLLLLLWAGGCRVERVETLARDDAARRELPDRFSLLSWNVQKGKEKNLPTRLQQLADELAPDLIFLQEADAKIVQVDGYGGVFAPGWSYPWPGGREIGVAILSTVVPVGIEKLPTKDREFAVTAPKVSLAATWDLPGNDTLLVINLHCLAFERGKKLKGYRRQLAGIEAVLAEHDGPLVIAGDFNTWNTHRLELVRDLAARLELVEVETFDEEAPRTTGDRGSDGSNRFWGVDPDLALDRVFVRDLTVLDARVLNETSSDHMPLFVRLSVPAE